jgi:hypothetical protein
MGLDVVSCATAPKANPPTKIAVPTLQIVHDFMVHSSISPWGEDSIIFKDADSAKKFR